MRLVAGFAGNAAGMLLGIDLREGFGFGGARRVAADAEDRGIELGRRDRGIVGVLGQGPVAGFAVDVDVLAGLLGVEDIRVTGLARLVAGIVDRLGCDLGYGSATIVAVLSEGLGHNKVADYKEHRKGGDEQESEPE